MVLQEVVFWLLISVPIGATAAVTIWIEHVHRKEQKRLKEDLGGGNSC